jgi:hypothetical protein
MASSDKKTHYEVLSIPRTAKVTDIGRAYNRLRAEMQKDSWAPDARFAAQVQAAYDTLSDPDKRDAYDRSLDGVAPMFGKGRRGAYAAAFTLVVAAGAAAAWHAFLRGPQRPAEKMVEPAELLQSVSTHVGKVQGSLVTGEVRDLGAAVAVGDGQMATTCRDFTPGATLRVRSADYSSNAEVLRANEELGVCMLAVKSASAGLPLREIPLAARDNVIAVVPSEKGPHSTRKGTVVRAVADARGPVVELKFATPLPHGTPVFDGEGRLAAMVSAHSPVGGTQLAFATSRITMARAGVPSTQVLPSVPVAVPVPASAAPSSAAEPEDSGAAPKILVTPEGDRLPLPKKDPRQAAQEERVKRILEEAGKAR